MRKVFKITLSVFIVVSSFNAIGIQIVPAVLEFGAYFIGGIK